MQAELLQATTGLVFTKDESLKPAANLKQGDDVDIIRILYGLSVLHLQLEHGRGNGNVSAAALKRTQGGRLILSCIESNPSKCELTAANDDDARFFVDVGEMPRQIDDLVALGVALAELLIPPGIRPALSATYREDLAAKIPQNAYRRSDRLRNKIVKSLLLSDKSEIHNTSDFLRRYVPMVRISGDMKLKPVGWYDAMRAFPLLTIAGMALAAVCGWVVWKDQQGLRLTIEKLNIATSEKGNLVSKVNEWEANAANLTKDLENRKSEVKDLNSKVQTLEAEIAELTNQPKNPGTTTDPVGAPITVVTNDLRYRWFEKDVNLKNDKRFQSILSKSHIDKEEATYADQRLTDFNKAAKEWWKMVEDEATVDEIKSRNDGQSDPEVQAALKVWFAHAVTRHDYVIELDESTVPTGFKDYKFCVTIRHEDINKEIRATANAELILAEPSGKALSSISLSWKAGQPINLYLESSSFFNWNDQFETGLKGGLALSLLEKRIFGSKEGFLLDFTVKGHPGLPGPPVASAGVVPIKNIVEDFERQVSAGGPTSTNVKTSSPDSGGAKTTGTEATIPINPLDELK